MSCTTGQLPSPPDEITVTLPAGMQLTSIPSPVGLVGTDFSAVQSIMSQLGPALAALQPALILIDAVTALFTVLERAPEIPVDPAGFIQALDDARVKVGKVATLIPQLSVPLMVVTTISAVAKYLTAVIGQLTEIVDAQASAQTLMDQAIAEGDTALQTEAQCALTNAETLTAHAGAALGPVTGILGSISSLIGFLPAPVDLPSMPDPAGQSAQELIDALQPIVAVLEAIQI